VGGAFSALLTIASLDSPGKQGYLLGAIFGITITICFAASGLLKHFWQPILQVCAATIAYVLAMMAACFLQFGLHCLGRRLISREGSNR
jgi:ABC-type nitrate/sulfonate/bicarbonate transport system permease component